jgi:hypothetical protein
MALSGMMKQKNTNKKTALFYDMSFLLISGTLIFNVNRSQTLALVETKSASRISSRP